MRRVPGYWRNRNKPTAWYVCEECHQEYLEQEARRKVKPASDIEHFAIVSTLADLDKASIVTKVA